MTGPEEMATAAGLRYVDEEMPGERRIRRGRRFSYVDRRGSVVSDSRREWIESLVIPPAWEDVWIAPGTKGHLLATGVDAAGRKQHIYHPDWAEARDAAKFERMETFGRRLTRLRRDVDADLRRSHLPRRKVVALAVAVLDQTLIRVGGRQWEGVEESYGLTTLTTDQVEVEGGHVHIEYAAKGGMDHELAFRDRRLAGLIARCQELGGQTLFSYETGEETRSISSTDVNDYLDDTMGADFSAKDFRTWGASALVTGALAITEEAKPETAILEAIDHAADLLGNTRAVFRGSYLHPAVPEAYLKGRLDAAWRRSRRGRWLSRPESTLNRVLA